MKTLKDIVSKLDKLDDRIYDNNIKTATAVYSGDVDPHSGMIVTPPYTEGQPEGQPCFD
ncbi:MAG: hypothetical protein AB9922_12130 [Bacteroidales bacterium]